MSFDTPTNNGNEKEERKYYDRNKSDDLQISRTDMNMLIMNYLVTEGFKEAALKFQQEAGLQEPALCSSLDERIMIREAVQTGRIPDAIAMVNALHPELLDNDRYLYFHLQQLQLLELIRAGRAEEALAFASATLAEAGANDPNALTELERSLALLAFPDPHTSPFADLLLPSHSQKIASELNAAILKMENQEYTNPKLCSLLRMILWSQSELDKHNIKYSKMTDLANATIEKPNITNNACVAGALQTLIQRTQRTPRLQITICGSHTRPTVAWPETVMCSVDVKRPQWNRTGQSTCRRTY